ncbi:winged helix-turn-helix domain-containing protein [Vibrio sp. ZSDE26]|uniref:Winged helix-turn-helix domain-containing protein n=1 Tax=Vibrio amylolyticus TaxID=2847292 RepID=A0A9X2BIC4_9VIBR|nr:winged helix-turn-helix domain-containing protein [Vibrio amylolyticus]MCK6263945.1 winged helix-turn-helix domain-containing protein [Vibrio amylolyticus]
MVMTDSQEDIDQQTQYRLGKCILVKDDSTSEIRLQNGKSFSLTQPESAILRCLYEHNGNIVSKHDLIIAGWGRPDIIGSNSLPVAMTNIRKILKLAEVEITNVPRIGYKLEIPPIELRVTPSMDDTPQKGVKKYQLSYAFSIVIFYAVLSMTVLCILFVSTSWVTTQCTVIDMVNVCYNSREKHQSIAIPSTLSAQPNDTFYLSGQNWIKVENNE